MKMCTRLISEHDNKVDIVDIVIEGNTAFVLFVWSGVITSSEHPTAIGKEFKIHDCYAWCGMMENLLRSILSGVHCPT